MALALVQDAVPAAPNKVVCVSYARSIQDYTGSRTKESKHMPIVLAVR